MKYIRSIKIICLALVNLIVVTRTFSQTDVPSQDTTNKLKSIKPLMLLTDTAYQRNTASGEYAAGQGKGFQLVTNKFTSLNVSIYAMVRYLNQLPGKQTWQDHLGRTREFVGRNDFHWHRTMIWFSGFVGTPKFTYMATVWTV